MQEMHTDHVRAPSKSREVLETLGNFANVFKAFIGVNYLVMAFAMSQAGIILGSVGILVVAVVTSHCCQLIVKCKRTAVAKIAMGVNNSDEIEDAACSLQYGDVAIAAIGNNGRALVDTFLVLTQFGFCVSYFIFIGSTLNALAPSMPVDGTIGIFAVLEGLISLIRDLRHLSGVSVIANIALLYGFVVVLSHEAQDFSVNKDIVYARWDTAPIFFGLATGAYEGIGTIIPIESSMREKRGQFTMLLRAAVICVTVILGSFGILGYLVYGPDVDQIIISELPDNGVSRAVRIGLLVGVVCTFPLQMYPVIEIFEGLLGRMITPHGEGAYLLAGPASSARLGPISRTVLRFVLVAGAAGLAILFQNTFGYFSSIVGAVGSSALAFVLPALFDCLMHRALLTPVLLAKNALIIAFGVLGGAAGLYTSIKALV
eukprot:m.60122 g.60122  ORF g.60122 m.60122 type:complete len:430 (-) comp7006_c0_seq2:144-1433(-)